ATAERSGARIRRTDDRRNAKGRGPGPPTGRVPMNARLAAAAAACLAVPALAQNAGPNKVGFPENWSQGVMYATVDRHDIKQYRELWSTKAALDAVKAGKPIPSGTVLTLVQYKAVVDDKGNVVKDGNGRFRKGDLVAYTVMEKRAGWGAEYPGDI